MKRLNAQKPWLFLGTVMKEEKIPKTIQKHLLFGQFLKVISKTVCYKELGFFALHFIRDIKINTKNYFFSPKEKHLLGWVHFK